MGWSCHGLGEQFCLCQHQVSQAKERVELGCVFLESSVTHLATPEEVLHHMKGAPHLYQAQPSKPQL